MIGSGRARRRLDELRRRFDRGSIQASASVTDAAERLVLAVEEHVARTEEARSSTDQVIRALDLVPQGLVFADASGETAFCNRAASAFFDARHGDALVGSAIEELTSRAVTGERASRTVELFGPPRRALQLSAVPLRDPRGPDVAGAFLIVEDVSERQRLESMRRDFVANISHELKTPVGALSVLAEMLASETEPEVVERMAARMQREAMRLAKTIDDLLELSRIETGESSNTETTAVTAILGEAVDRSRHGAEQRGVQIDVALVDSDLLVEGDRRQLVSAVANLCDNAVKYSDAGDTVEVSARVDQEMVAIEVTDHGIGIPASDLERVFERFYRVDRARSRDTGGTGLGLAIVRHVAHNHSGRIDVSSHEGEGSTFTLFLPSKDIADEPIGARRVDPSH